MTTHTQAALHEADTGFCVEYSVSADVPHGGWYAISQKEPVSVRRKHQAPYGQIECSQHMARDPVELLSGSALDCDAKPEIRNKWILTGLQ